MRSDNLLIAETLLHLAQVVLQAQTELGTLWQPDGQTLADLIAEHEQLHLLTNLTMVALLSLLQHHEILVEHLLLGERDTIQALHLLTSSVTTPEGTGNTRQLDGLDFARIHEVRTTAEVGEVTLRICRDRTVFQVLLDVLALIGLAVGSKLLQRIGLSYLLANDRLLLGGQLTHLVFNHGEVALLDHLAILQQHVVEEAVLDSRTKAELNTRIQLLQRLGQEVC